MLVGGLFVAVGAGLACGVRRDPPNLVVFLLDTVRADAVSVDGGGPDVTPTLRGLADEGVVFESAFTHTTWTKPAVATLFTSRFPRQHGVRNVAMESEGRLVSQRLPADLETLAERLQAAGYHTCAIINQTHLRAKFGFSQGFDDYWAFRGKGAAHLNGVLQQWLEARPPEEARRPVFLYVHYLDPHWPYLEREERLRRALGSLYLEREPPRGGDRVEAWVGAGLSPEEAAALKARYLHGVAHTDRELGRAVELLKRHLDWENTVVLVTSDHGEGFYEHGQLMHGFAPYEEVHRVPMVLRLPERLRGEIERTDALVGLVDVLPTLLDLAGLPPLEGAMGRSLVPILREGRGRSRPVFSETEEILSLRTERHKLIRFPTGREEFFDLVDDPAEHTPLPCDETCVELGRQLTELATLLDLEALADDGSVELDEADLERLRALGYLND